MSAHAEDGSRRVGDLFVEKGLITREQLETALRLQQETGERLGEIVVAEFGVPRLELASVLAEQWAANDEAQAGGQAEMQAQRSGPPVAVTEEASAAVPSPGEPLLRRPIGEIFVERGFISDDQLQSAIELQRKTGQRLGEVLVEQGALSRLDLASALADQWANLQHSAPPVDPAFEQAPAAPAPQPAPQAALANDVLETLSARIGLLERSVASVADKTELDVTTGELRAALAALEQRLSEEVALDEEKAMAAIVAKIDAMRTVLDEPLQRLAALEQRLPDGGTLAELEQRVRAELAALEQRLPDGSNVAELDDRIHAELDALGARIDEVASGPSESEIAEIKETLTRLVERPGPTTEAFEALQQAVERLGTKLTQFHQPAVDPEVSDKLDAVAGQVEAAQTGLASLASRLDELGALAGRLDEVAARVPRADVVEELRLSLTELAEQAAAQSNQPEYSGQIAALGARLDQVAAQVGDVTGQLEAVASAPPDDLAAEVAELALKLDELASAGPPVDVTALEGRLAELERARDEARALRENMDSLREGLDERRRSVDPALDDLRARVDQALSLEQKLAETRTRIDELAARAESLHADDLRPALDRLQERLDGLEQVIPAVPVDEIQARLSALEQGASGLARTGETLGELSDSLHERRAEIDARLAEVEQRLAGSSAVGDELRLLQQRVHELAAGDGARIDDLEARVRSVSEGAVGAGELASLVDRVDELAGRVQSVADDANGSDELAALRGRVEDLAGQLRSATEHAADSGELASLHGRVEELEGHLRAVSERAADSEELTGIRERVGDLSEELRAVAEGNVDPSDVAALRHRVEELAGALASSPASAELSERLGEIERQLANTVGVEAVRAELRTAAEASAAERETLERTLMSRIHDMVGVTAPVVDELTALGTRIDEVAARAAADAEARAALDDLRGRVDAALDDVSRIDDLAGRLASLEAVQGADEELPGRVASLEQALEVAERRLSESQRAAEHAAREHAERAAAEVNAGVAALRAQLAGLTAAQDERVLAIETRLEEMVDASRSDDVHARIGDLEARIAALPARDEIDVAASQLHGRADELQSALDDVRAETARVVDETESRLEHGAGALRQELEAAEARLGERATAQEAELAAMRAELAELGVAAGDREQWRDRVEAGLQARVEEVEQILSGQAAESRAALEATLAELRDALGEVTVGLGELGAQGANDAESARISDVELAARIDDVALRLAEGTATAEGALRRELEELASRLSTVEVASEGAHGAAREEVERLVASVGWRLERIEETLSSDHRSELHDAVERLEQRLDEQAAHAEEQVRVTEKALRKGLASLGARLTETHDAYTHAGDALRRSIERLGAAVADTDSRIEGREAAAEVTAPYAAATEFVAFAPTEEGYRLVVVEASLPEVGDEIEVPGVPGMLVVTRIGASPLPLDARPCAYLDRAAGRTA